MAISKFKTLVLLIHTTANLLLSILLQSFHNNTSLNTTISPSQLFLFHLSVYIVLSLTLFVIISILNYCCIPLKSRISIKRHIFTAVVLGPLLARITGRGMGWIVRIEEDKAVFASACYEQLDTRSETVLMAGQWCEFKTGVTRGEAERKIGRRREMYEYSTELGKACQEGLRDLENFQGPMAPVCWMGKGERVDMRAWEGRNSKKEYMRRGFEECHRRSGYEFMLEWKGANGDIPTIKIKMPDTGTALDGQYIGQDPDTFDLVLGV